MCGIPPLDSPIANPIQPKKISSPQYGYMFFNFISIVVVPAIILSTRMIMQIVMDKILQSRDIIMINANTKHFSATIDQRRIPNQIEKAVVI